MIKKNKIYFTSVLFNFKEGNATTNLACEIAHAFRYEGYEPELFNYGELFASKNYKGVYRKIDCKQYSGSFIKINWIDVRLRNIISSLRFCLKLIKKRKNIKLLFMCSGHTVEILAQVIAAKISGIPCVYHLTEEPISLHRPIKKSNYRKWFRYWRKVIFGYSFQYLFVFRLCNYICCITDELSQYLKKWGYSKHKRIIFPNVKCIYDKVADTNTTIPNKEFSVFYGGSIDLRKENIIPLIKAVESVSKNGVSINLNIVGEGRDAKKLCCWLSEHKITSVKYHGFVSRRKFLYYLNKADLCVLLKRNVPSNIFNFANKLTDYMKHSKTVLASNIPLHVRIIKNRENGILVDSEDSIAIKNEIYWAAKNRDEVSAIGIRGYETLQQQFDAVKHVSLLINKIHT